MRRRCRSRTAPGRCNAARRCCRKTATPWPGPAPRRGCLPAPHGRTPAAVRTQTAARPAPPWPCCCGAAHRQQPQYPPSAAAACAPRTTPRPTQTVPPPKRAAQVLPPSASTPPPLHTKKARCFHRAASFLLTGRYPRAARPRCLPAQCQKRHCSRGRPAPGSDPAGSPRPQWRLCRSWGR